MFRITHSISVKMAKRGLKDRHRFLAKLVTENKAPCAFCRREVDEETTYGKLYAIGDIQCHYFCVLLSCCLVQKGKDEEGLFGFLYQDILTELERSKKHRCSYCSRDGATLGCSVSQCRKQFHLPCGRQRNAVSLFYGNYKSFCELHAPKQKVPDVIMSKAKVRMQEKKRLLKVNQKQLEVPEKVDDSTDSLKTECVCVICYEEVDAYPTLQTFWPPCCARDAWFHRACLQRMALSAGMHYLKCPLCNDKENFYQAVVGQGFYVPDRDAAWELEQNAYAEIYERTLTCSLDKCECPLGRDHDSDAGMWDMKFCLLCGSVGAHAHCVSLLGSDETRYICVVCQPAAPEDLDGLAKALESALATEQPQQTSRRAGPRMPSRMSLRRTKQAAISASSSSQSKTTFIQTETAVATSNTAASRQDLNIRPPKKQTNLDKPELLNEKHELLKHADNFLSPVKLLEQTLREKTMKMGAKETQDIVLDEGLVARLRQKMGKPRPLSVKKRIVDNLLDELLKNMDKEKWKVKEPVKEWNSPKKSICNNTINVDNQNSSKATNQETHTNDGVILTEETTVKNFDEDSPDTTKKLPPKNIASSKNDNTLPIFDTPKKTKTVEIQKDSSMEIFENNDVVNIDLVKIENAAKKDFMRYLDLTSPQKRGGMNSPKDNKKVNMDIESFKNQYLNEVDRDFNCKFSHKHDNITEPLKLRTAIDFAIDAAAKENRKRKLKRKKSASKKKKLSHLVLQYVSESIEKKQDNTEKKKKKRNKKKKIETSLSITNDNMQVKISLKKERFKLKIMQSNETTPKTLKQYVLKYSAGSAKEVIEKPDKDVTPIKRKYVKVERSPDNFKQTSLHSFFKTKTPNK